MICDCVSNLYQSIRTTPEAQGSILNSIKTDSTVLVDNFQFSLLLIEVKCTYTCILSDKSVCEVRCGVLTSSLAIVVKSPYRTSQNGLAKIKMVYLLIQWCCVVSVHRSSIFEINVKQFIYI